MSEDLGYPRETIEVRVKNIADGTTLFQIPPGAVILSRSRLPRFENGEWVFEFLVEYR